MNNYDDATRGTYQNVDFAKQLVSFEGMTFIGSSGIRNVTPTDIDGYIQLDNQNAFIFFELKHGETHLPNGQAKAFMRLIDALCESGKNAILFVGKHDCEAEEHVIAGEAEVDRYYINKQWIHVNPAPLKNYINGYLEYISRKEQIA